jgi:hypothetical protein
VIEIEADNRANVRNVGGGTAFEISTSRGCYSVDGGKHGADRYDYSVGYGGYETSGRGNEVGGGSREVNRATGTNEEAPA